jgi:DNA invertase Pin-like site-specific DNA recombinase
MAVEDVSEHQHEGMAGAKLRSKHRGRTPSIKPEEVTRLRKTLSPTEIAKRLGIARSSVYRILAGHDPDERM